MNDLDIKNILPNLEQYNSELDLEEYQILALNNYNNQFRNKIISSKENLVQEEYICNKSIENISVLIEQNKETFNFNIQRSKNINQVKYDEKIAANRETYDNEIKKINEEINSYVTSFEKQLESITSATYYKKLDINQTKKDYEKYLFDIKKNYNSSVDFFHNRRESKINTINEVMIKSKSDLEETLLNIESLFDGGFELEKEEKKIKLDSINKEIEENEKLIFNKKIEMNEQIELISSKNKALLERILNPHRNHIDYLQQEIKLLQQKLTEDEILCLDVYKRNLEIADKKIEIQKNKSIKRQNEIKKLTKDNPSSSLQKENDAIDHSVVVFSESMRSKKLEYDIKKNFDIDLLYLTFNEEKNIIEKKIILFQKKILLIENSVNYNESLKLSKLRTDMEVYELSIKNELDILKQKKYLLDSIDKLNTEHYTFTKKAQIELKELSLDYNQKYFDSIKNNINTLTSLEIEKNFILKKYNIEVNELLVKKSDLLLSLIKIDEATDANTYRLDNELNKRILSQDIQFGNKKLELFKNLITLEKDYNDKVSINENNYKLEIKTYNIFENRFSIEKNLYKIYFDTIKTHIQTIELYFNKYNNVTRCRNTNITFATFSYLTTYLKNSIISLLKKIINVISNRITFEGTINFQYELNRLIQEKDQNELWYNTTLEKYEETIANYNNTISLYKEKISLLEKESDQVRNQMILKDLELVHIDVKNSAAITKVQQDSEILKNRFNDYKKEIKMYGDLINKNLKLIIDFNKDIPYSKRKYYKKNQILEQQLATIEKRHKQESSVYYNFINKIEQLIKEVNFELNEDIKENPYNYFKKFTSTIYSSIVNFETYDIDVLFNKLVIRHEGLISEAQEKYRNLVEDSKSMYQSDTKRISTVYSERIFEIEKKVDKIITLFETKKRDLINSQKERSGEIKNKIKEIEALQNQKKASLLYNINSFTENISQYTKINNLNIEELKVDRSSLTKKYFSTNDESILKKDKKKLHLERQSNYVIASLKYTYSSIIKEKQDTYNSKVRLFNERINESEKLYKQALHEYKSILSSAKIEDSMNKKNLDKKYESSLYTLKKSYIQRINKENKKFNKIK